MKKLLISVIFLAVLGFTTIVNATLVDNGIVNGAHLIYDTDLNITWYDDVAHHGGWDASKIWAASLTVSNTTAGSWRLPNTVDAPIPDSGNGSTRYNITNSEMGHLFYVELGNKGSFDIDGHPLAIGLVGLLNKGPFENLQAGFYWSGTVFSQGTDQVWAFSMANGEHRISDKYYHWNYDFAMAVHDGNIVAPVPVPGALFLLAPSLAGLIAVKKRKKR